MSLIGHVGLENIIYLHIRASKSFYNRECHLGKLRSEPRYALPDDDR